MVSAAAPALKGLDDDTRLMVQEIVAKVKKQLLPRDRILEWDRKESFPEDVIRKMLGPEIGLQLLFIPEEYGGMGGGARDCCAVTRDLSAACLGVSTAFFAIQLGADPLLVGGTNAQKAKWLGAIAEGRALVGYAVTEPNAGSNLAALTTRAEPILDDRGNVTAYRINGSKQFISNGGYADFVTLLAMTPQGPAFFVVEKGTSGFVQGKGEEKHGIRASNTSPLSLTDVVVPADHLIGDVPGEGLKQASAVFGYTRVMVGAMALGAGEAALKIVTNYAKERIQFGGPLAEKQGYTHKLVVPHAVKLAAAAAYIDEIAHRLDAGEPDMQVEGSIAKLFTTEAACRAVDDALQGLGGYGYINEYMVEKIRRDVKITTVYEGTSEIQQSIISTFRWKKTRKSKGRFYGAQAEEMLGLAREFPDAGFRVTGDCAQALNHLVMLADQHKLTRQQHIMFALADMISWTEVGLALARKTAQLLTTQKPAAAEYQDLLLVFNALLAEQILNQALEIGPGTGTVGLEEQADFLHQVNFSSLLAARHHTVAARNRVADRLFGRAA